MPRSSPGLPCPRGWPGGSSAPRRSGSSCSRGFSAAAAPEGKGAAAGAARSSTWRGWASAPRPPAHRANRRGAVMKDPQPKIGPLMLVWLALAATTAGSARGLLPGEELTPSGLRRETAVYVTMRDGVEIAVDVWLPANHRQGDRWPVLMKTTRYWRSNGTGWGLRALAALHIVRADSLVDRQRAYFNSRGYVLLKVDARGSGASGGQRVVEYSPRRD